MSNNFYDDEGLYPISALVKLDHKVVLSKYDRLVIELL